MVPVYIGACVLFLDILTKYLTLSYVPALSSHFYPFGGIGVFDSGSIQFALNYVTNTGMAWSLFAGYAKTLLVLRISLIGFLIIYYCRSVQSLSIKLPLALIIAGAIGNVVDVFVYGHVIDMLHFVFWGYDYPVFNLADSAICVGIISYLISSTVCSYAATR